MKRFVTIALFLFLVFSLTSCFFGTEPKSLNDCDHEWTTVITGGQVNIDSVAGTQTVGQSCTVIKTCTKCGAQEGATVNPTSDLSFDYSADVIVSYGTSTAKSIIIPAQISVDSATPVAVKIVGDFASTKINDVTIVSGIKEISDSAFNDCKVLESIIIPDSVDTIGFGVFTSCYNLKTVVLPSDFTFDENTHSAMFSECYGLKSVTPSTLVCQANAAYFYYSYILLDKNGLTVL